MTDTTRPDETPEVAYSTTQDAAQALLARWNAKAETPRGDDTESESPSTEDQQQTDSEQADEARAEDSGEADDQSEVEYEFDVAGEKLKLPEKFKGVGEFVERTIKELQSGSTRKFQEVAEARKQIDADRERFEYASKVATARLELDAELKSVEQQIAAYDQIDWNALADANPVLHGKELANARTLDRRLQALKAKRESVTAELTQSQIKDWEARVNRTREYAASSIKGWSESVDNELGAYVGKRQLGQQEVRALSGSPSLYEMAYKAMRYDQLQEARPVEKKAVQATKTLRPGTAAAPSTSAKQRFEEAKKRAFKSGSTEDIASALLARSMFRK